MNIGQENELQEFKESLSQLDKGLKSLTAMLNRHGTGSVYFGVDDNGNVKGISIGKKTCLDIRRRIRDLIEPQILANIEELRDEKGYLYIKLSANGTDTPYSCDGRYYVRNVSADESVSNEMLRKMLVTGDTDLIRQIPSDNQELTFAQFFTFLAGHGIHTTNPKTVFKSYSLINSNGEFNLMALLLSDQNSFSIKVVKFSGADKTAMSERTEYGRKCLLCTVQEVLDYFNGINTTMVDVTGATRHETNLFSYPAFREAWINACLHNAWNERIPPAIYIFDDRIEVVSYGGLPYGLTKEGFYNGTSLPINKSLLTLFILSDYSEQSGHGVPTIVTDYGREAFSFEDEMLKVSLKYHFVPDNVLIRKQKEANQAELTENQRKVYAYLSDNPKATLQEASEELGISLAGVKKIALKLQELELLKRTGSKRIGRWETVSFKQSGR